MWWLGGKGNNSRDTLRQSMPGIILWHIWKAYNACVWDAKTFSRTYTINTIKDYTRQWVYNNQHKKCIQFDEELHCDGILPLKQIALKWKIYGNQELTLNTDATFFVQQSGGGAILRTPDGTFIHAVAFPLSAINPLQAEILTIESSIEAMINTGYKSFTVQTDSEISVRMLHGFFKVLDYLARPMVNINRLRLRHDIHFCYRLRETNACAHHIARSGLLLQSMQSYALNDLPSRARRAYFEDKNGSTLFRYAG
ncbi:unnamed protein product [Cuscuta epithymum]|uniref:RNase H type-1 domain-containing protein n=1 Tax=Cuscuta epithymum TaxID=186058 RepID=A0AAV0FX43_9ASTE|nr:unnamed protein product [Cuscuta epithymum]